VTATQNDPLFLATRSNTLQFTNFEALITNTSVQGCPYIPLPNGTCFQGRVPEFAIDARSVGDIQNTILFASKYNLHLVVKNTGCAKFRFESYRNVVKPYIVTYYNRHELMGRAFGLGAVELFVNNMKGISFSDNFLASGAPDHAVGDHGREL
jgi:hypothetical protein